MLDSGGDLAGTALAELTINGQVIGPPANAYSVTCVAAGECTVKLGGPDTASLEFDVWWDAVRGGDTATRVGSLTERTSPGGTAVRRFHLSGMRLTGLIHRSGRYQLTLQCTTVQRVAP
jgi:hypothetical protein